MEEGEGRQGKERQGKGKERKKQEDIWGIPFSCSSLRPRGEVAAQQTEGCLL